MKTWNVELIRWVFMGRNYFLFMQLPSLAIVLSGGVKNRDDNLS